MEMRGSGEFLQEWLSELSQWVWGSLTVAIVFQLVGNYFITLPIDMVIPMHMDLISAFGVGQG